MEKKYLLFQLFLFVFSLTYAQQPKFDSFIKICHGTSGFPTGVLDNSDLFGASVAGIGDLDGDGIEDVAVGAQWDDDGGTDRGAVYILFLNIDGSVKDTTKISNNKNGMGNNVLQNVDIFGCSIANIGDIDGDGVVDLAVGAMYSNDGGGSDRGSLWILRMNTDGTVKAYQKISDTAGNFLGTLNIYSYLGASIAGMGDLNNDGINDIAVGAPQDNDGGSYRGAVWIMYLDTNGIVKDYKKISDTAGSFYGTLDGGDFFGIALANIGDLNEDGIIDLAVGAYYDDDSITNSGAVWILFLDTNETVKSYQKISLKYGDFTGTLENTDLFGIAISNLGDLNGDDINDILVGARYDDDGGTNRGAVWILNLDTNGKVKSNYKLSDTLTFFSGNLSNSDGFGTSIANIGDINNDGSIDFIVGALLKDAGGTDRGAVFIFDFKDYRNNIFINTFPLSGNIPYQLDFQSQNYEFTTGGAEKITVINSPTTQIAVITVADTTAYDSLKLLFDVNAVLNAVQISNVRIITDSLSGGDTLSLDSSLYQIINDGHELVLFQRDTSELLTDSIFFGFVLEGGLGFSPNGVGGYEVLTVVGLGNISSFDLTIKTLGDSTVFATTTKSNFWDGKYQGTGTLVPEGVYKYVVVVNSITFKGQILVETSSEY